jgi:HEAT repeat protein
VAEPSAAPDAKTAVLIGNLHDKNAGIRAGAATALGELGAQAKGAVPELTQALKDNDESVRRHAAAALMKVDPAAAVSAGLR